MDLCVETYKYNVMLNGFEPQTIAFVDELLAVEAVKSLGAEPLTMYVVWDLDTGAPGEVLTVDAREHIIHHGFTSPDRQVGG